MKTPKEILKEIDNLIHSTEWCMFKGWQNEVAILEKLKSFILSSRPTDLNYKELPRDDKGRFLPVYMTIAYFKYPHEGIGRSFDLERKILVQDMNKTHIEGYDNKDSRYKRFRRDRIVKDSLVIKRERIDYAETKI